MKAYRNAALIVGSLVALLVVSYGQVPSELFAPVAAAFGGAVLFVGFLVVQTVREDMRDRDEVRRNRMLDAVSGR